MAEQTCPWHGQAKDSEFSCSKCPTVRFVCGCLYHYEQNAFVRGHAEHPPEKRVRDPNYETDSEVSGDDIPSAEFHPTAELHFNQDAVFWHHQTIQGLHEQTHHQQEPSQEPEQVSEGPQGPMNFAYYTRGGALVTGSGLAWK